MRYEQHEFSFGGETSARQHYVIGPKAKGTVGCNPTSITYAPAKAGLARQCQLAQRMEEAEGAADLIFGCSTVWRGDDMIS